jgi:hypothetical protein
MSILTTFVQQTVSRTRRSLEVSARTGRRSLALGAALLIGSTVTVLATANTPPHITSVTVTPNVSKANEGQSVTVNVAFTDPDPNDLHTIYFDWHKGSLGKFQLPAGQHSFQTTIKLPDDSDPNVSNPQIWVRVSDRQFPQGQPNDNQEGKGGHDFSSFPMKIQNVAPTFARELHAQKVRGEMGKVVVEGDIADPGEDTFQVFAIWDTSGPQLGPGQACSVTKRHFTCEHTYAVGKPVQSKTYSTKFTVRDDDGGQNVATMSVQIP